MLSCAGAIEFLVRQEEADRIDELPTDILIRIADDALPVVLRWWASLTSIERGDALAVWDEERQAAYFTPDVEGEPVPVVIGGRFVPVDEPQLVGPEWHADYFEYLLKCPELLLELPEVAVVGVCTAHPEARAALAAGCIPNEFVCPLSQAECPMRHLLAKRPHRSLHLTLWAGRLFLSQAPRARRAAESSCSAAEGFRQ